MAEFPRDADIIPLDQYRALVGTKPTEAASGSLSVDKYEPAGYLAFRVAANVMRLLGQQQPFALMIAEESEEPSQVFRAYSDNQKGMKYALRLNASEKEALTIDLEDETEEDEDRLLEPLRLFHVGVQLANYLLRNDKKIVYDPKLSDVRIGEETVHLEERKRWREVTTWRIASRIGIVAVASKRPRLAEDIEDHLADILPKRLLYVRSSEDLCELLGIRLPDDAYISDALLGIGNPINRFEIDKVVREKPSSDVRR